MLKPYINHTLSRFYQSGNWSERHLVQSNPSLMHLHITFTSVSLPVQSISQPKRILLINLLK